MSILPLWFLLGITRVNWGSFLSEMVEINIWAGVSQNAQYISL